jgi:hypothetical protein
MPLDDANWPTIEVDETTEILIRARGFLERGWCRNTLARDADGNAIKPISERAVAWCAIGAVDATRMPWDTGVKPALLRLEAAIGGEPINEFNDHQETLGPVLAAFDRAIRSAASSASW